LSILSGAHNMLFPKIMDLLQRKGGESIRVIAGGIIPEKDIPGLKKAGISELFLPGTSTRCIIEWIEKNIERKEKQN